MTSFVPPTFTSKSALRVLRADRGHPGAVEHALDSRQRAAHRAPVAHLEPHALGVEALDRDIRRSVLDPQPQLVTALGEEARDV